MVDFNSQTTVATPAVDVLRILVLQRRNDFIEAKEVFRKNNLSQDIEDVHILRARLESLRDEISSALAADMKPEEFAKFNREVDGAETFDKIRTCFYEIDRFLYRKRLTKIDAKQQYDTTLVTEDDRANNL